MKQLKEQRQKNLQEAKSVGPTLNVLLQASKKQKRYYHARQSLLTLHKIADMCSSLFRPVSFDEDKEEEELLERSMKQRRMTMLLEMAAKKLPIILPEEVVHKQVILDEQVIEKDLKALNYKFVPLLPLNPPLFADELPYANIPMR